MNRGLMILLPVVALAAAPDNKLIEAVERGDRVTAAGLIRQGADVNVALPDGTTALHYAAHRGDLETAEILLRAGAKAGAVNSFGVTALGEATASGNGLLVQKLL